MRDQRGGEDDGDVQRRERGDALRTTPGQRVVALIDKRRLQRRGPGLRQRRVEVRRHEDRPERRDDQVGDDAEDPVEAERGDVPEPGDRVRRGDQRRAERDRHEREEEEVDHREHMGRDAGPEQVVQERPRVVPEEHAAIERQQVRVVVLVGQERQEALEVPVGQVRDVERQQPEADRREAAAVPALARDGAQRDVDAAGALDRTRQQVEDHEEGDRADQPGAARAEHFVRVAYGEAVRQSHDRGGERHRRGDPERGPVPAPRQGVVSVVGPDRGTARIGNCSGGHLLRDCERETRRVVPNPPNPNTS